MIAAVFGPHAAGKKVLVRLVEVGWPNAKYLNNTQKRTLKHVLSSSDLYVGALAPEGVRGLYRYAKECDMLRRVCWIWLDTNAMGELAARMRKRGDKEADIQKRVLEAQDWRREWREMSLPDVLQLDAFRPQSDHCPKVLEYLQTKMPHS